MRYVVKAMLDAETSRSTFPKLAHRASTLN
jgi:hypothetical protein